MSFGKTTAAAAATTAAPCSQWQLLHTTSTTITRGVFRKIELKPWCPIVWWYAGFRDADVLPDHGAGAQNTPQARSHRSHQRHCILCENGGQRTNTHNTDSTRLITSIFALYSRIFHLTSNHRRRTIIAPKAAY